MRLGYARVSSADQNLDRQISKLNQFHIDKLFQEKISGKDTHREQLQALLSFVHQNDEIVVLSLDRLGRNSEDLTQIIETIRRKGAVLNVLDLPSFEGICDRNLKALLTNLVLEVQKYTAENERQKIRERQRQGIKEAKKRGVYKGRKIQYSAYSNDPEKRMIYLKIVSLLSNTSEKKKISITEIARQTGVAKNTVYRIKKQLLDSNYLMNS